MTAQPYPSRLLEQAVQQVAKLPGIGRKTALRLVLHLLRQPTTDVEQLAQALATMRRDVKHCRHCHNISDSDLCPVCADPRRDNATICVVENIQDVMAIENTQQYHGLYHVLGGLISPMDGIGPSDLEIDSLVERVAHEDVNEVILALSPTMEGDATSFYIFRKLSSLRSGSADLLPEGHQKTQISTLSVTVIARGIAVGNELEYTDEVTLGRSILNRTPFNVT